jgi:hypothetical protein
MKHTVTDKERVWRATEMVAALKHSGGQYAEQYADDLDDIERRLLLGLLDPFDEAGLEIVYWGAFGKPFEP